MNPFPKLDPILKSHLENGVKNPKMTSLKIQNDIIACLAQFIRKGTKEVISEYYTTIADEVIHRFSSKKIVVCLRYVTFQDDLPVIHYIL